MEVDFVKGAQHCALEECRLRDFLPFRCGLCEKTFCLDHRKPADHSCPVPIPDNTTVFCPICKAAILVRFSEGENAQQNLAEHANSKCRKHALPNKPKYACGVEKCKKQSDVPFDCSICEKQFCLRHRAPDNHECTGPPDKSMCTMM